MIARLPRIRRCLAVLFACCLLAPVALHAAEPELSADQPITADLNSQELVAIGNARFVHDEIVLEADEIRYNQAATTLTATGNVRVTRRGLRIVSERVTYNVETRAFTSGAFRAGIPPIFIEGQSFAGTLEKLALQHIAVYYLEPQESSPSLRFREATIEPGERIAARGVGLGVPFVGTIPLPSFDRAIDAAPLVMDGNLGYRGNLGAYIQSEILAPVGEDLLLGSNLDLYSKRGILLGPSLRYRSGEGEHHTDLQLSTGWIADQGDPEDDVLGRPIDDQRYFGELGLRHTRGRLEVVAQGNILSDSEVERDFRPDRFESRPQATSFLEVTQLLGDDVFLSVLLEASPNDFFRNVERLPEITLTAPLRPLGGTGLLASFETRVRRLRVAGESPPLQWSEALGVPYFPGVAWQNALDLIDVTSDGLVDLGADHWIDTAEATAGLRYPIVLAPWIVFTPLAEGRATYLSNDDITTQVGGTSIALDDVDRTRLTGAVGFDLDLSLHADFDLRSDSWGVHGLRHVLEPVLSYRYFSFENEADLQALFPVFDTTRGDLSLLTRRDAFEPGGDRHTLRLGLRNTFLTAREAGGERRELLSLDYYFEASEPTHDAWSLANSSYLELATRPARWLELRAEQRYDHDEDRLQELRFRALLRSAESWQLGFSVDYFSDVTALGEETFYHQFRLDGAYRLTERTTLIGSLRYDARIETITRQVYGLRYRIGLNWELEGAVVFRSGAQREDDFTFRAAVRLIEF